MQFYLIYVACLEKEKQNTFAQKTQQRQIAQRRAATALKKKKEKQREEEAKERVRKRRSTARSTHSCTQRQQQPQSQHHLTNQQKLQHQRQPQNTMAFRNAFQVNMLRPEQDEPSDDRPFWDTVKDTVHDIAESASKTDEDSADNHRTHSYATNPLNKSAPRPPVDDPDNDDDEQPGDSESAIEMGGIDKAPKSPEEFDWGVARHPPNPLMKKYIQVNCLHKGNFMDGTKKWMVPVDGTTASWRAFEHCLEAANESDHIVVIHVREHDSVGYPVRDAYTEWYNGVQLLKRYDKHFQKVGRDPATYTLLMPSFYDARKIVIKFARKLDIDAIVVGQHTEEDKDTRRKNSHWRTFASYMRKQHKTGETIVL